VIHDIKKYKLAKIYIKDIIEIINRLNVCRTLLEPYVRYKSVKIILININKSLDSYNNHKIEQENIYNSKARID